MIRILKLLAAGSLHASHSINYFLIDPSRLRKDKSGQLINRTWEMIQQPGSLWSTTSSVHSLISGLPYERYKWQTCSLESPYVKRGANLWNF